MTDEEIQNVLGEIVYPKRGWFLSVFTNKNERPYLQWQVYPTSSKEEAQNGRKWYLSRYMTKSELVQTAFKAAITFEEHECREMFTYRGRKIFSPHFDIDSLWEISGQKKHLDVRSAKEE